MTISLTTNEDNQITALSIHAEGLKITSFSNKDSAMLASFAQLVDPSNLNAASNDYYNKPERATPAYNGCGGADEGKVQRCFLVTKEGDEGSVVGLINVRYTTLTGRLLEGHALFHHDYNASDLPSKALEAIYVDYTKVATPLLSTPWAILPGFMYVVSPHDPLLASLNQTTLTHFDSHKVTTDAEQYCMFMLLQSDRHKRFQVVESGVFEKMDGSEQPKEVFFSLHDMTDCPGLPEAFAQHQEL